MTNNPQKPKIILFDRSEITVEHNKQYLVVHGKGGEIAKIASKRQHLWEAFNTAFDGEAFLLLYETYNNVEYVADVKKISNELLNRAIQDIGLKLADQNTEERNRSTALSYSKDLVVGNSITFEELYEVAESNYLFIKGVYEKQHIKTEKATQQNIPKDSQEE